MVPNFFMKFSILLGFISLSKLTDLTEKNKWTSPKKNSHGLDLNGSGQRSAGPAQIIGRSVQDRHPIPADSQGPAISGSRGRSGTRQPQPFDQVKIDGWRLSSPRGQARAR
jgi:hypothetical protein